MSNYCPVAQEFSLAPKRAALLTKSLHAVSSASLPTPPKTAR